MEKAEIKGDDPIQSTLTELIHLLPLTIIVLASIWYVKYHWDRRRIYQLASKIPGPRGLPIIGDALPFLKTSTADIFNVILMHFRANPEVFRVWFGNELNVCISKPEHFEIILNHPNCLEKDRRYRILTDYIGNGILTAPAKIWKKNRKMINPAFNQKILNSFVPIFNDTSNILLGKLGEGSTDILRLVSACNVDAICETAMGVKVNAQTTFNHFGKLLDRVMTVMFIRVMNVFYHNDVIFKFSKYHDSFKQSCKTLREFTDEIVVPKKKEFLEKMEALKRGEIVEDEKKVKTFLDLLLHFSYKEEIFTDVELRDETSTFVGAASDTTATTTCFTLLCLGMHQEIQQKVYEEIKEALIDDRDITHADLPNFPYLERVIKESLRLFPAGPLIARTSTTEIAIEEYIIPAGSRIIMPFIYTHRLSKYWKDPLKFDPDRFLPEEISKRHPYTYLPFSGGPRGCIGSKYAMMALKTFLSNIIRTYKVNCDYKTIEEVKLKVHIVLRPLEGFKVTFESRK